MKKNKSLFITILLFTIFVLLFVNYFVIIFNNIKFIIPNFQIRYLITYIVVGLPIIIYLLFYFKWKIISELGLNCSIIKGALPAFIFTLPMIIGYYLLFEFNKTVSFNFFLINCVYAAFFEELFFRGFFFKQLFNNLKIGFVPSITIGAFVFGILHLHQSTDIYILLGVFLTTALGAMFYSWLFIEWNYNLWISIFMHFFMNCYWIMFNVSNNALGNINGNIFRYITVAFAIFGTIYYKKKNKLSFFISKNNLWKIKN